MLLLPALLCAATFGEPRPATPEVRRPTTPEEGPTLATWQELCDQPGRWLGKTVRLRIQFQAPVESWNPYLTRFGTRRFTAIQAWADEQLPWVKQDYETPAVRLFLRRGEACEWALEGAQKSARYEVTAVVHEVFLDLPWAEVIEVLPLAERIREGTVIHVLRALELMTARSWKLAALELDQAATDGLPPHAVEELARMRTICVEAQAGRKR